MLKKYYKFIVAIILAFFFILSLVVSWQESTIMDEQAHIPAAYTYVRYQDMRLNPEHPPLLKDLAGIPLLFFNNTFPTDDPAWTRGVNEQWVLGTKFIHMNNAELVTFWSRFPIILIALLLGWFIFRWTKELAGTIAGIFALILFAFDPNIIGHSHYVTTDIGIAAFIFFAFYYFLKFIKHPVWKNVLLAGIFLGLAQLAKFSAVLLFPYFGLVALIYAIFIKRHATDKFHGWKFRLMKLWEYIGKYAVAVIICFVLIWVVYYLNTLHMPPEKLQANVLKVFSPESPKAIDRLAINFVVGMSNISQLKGLGEYFLGIFMVFIRVSGGNTYYFFGEVLRQAKPSYFPAVFLMKETIPLLLLLLSTFLYSIFIALKNIYQSRSVRKFWDKFKEYLRANVVQWSMLGFVILYLYVSITGNLTIGFRHLFPILPFIYLLIAKSVSDLIKKSSQKSKKIFKTAGSIAVVWIILIPIVAFPSYLSYFNEFFGGPQNGYRYVTDSNVDWGQDMKRLQSWVNEYNYLHPLQKIEKINTAYFGGADARYYLGDKWSSFDDRVPFQPGWYAISAEFLQENLYKNPPNPNYSWIASATPIRIGDSIFVYYYPGN
ncbi:MAG: glycosyltransferase family 39 protein [Candidatus Moranbacteria bacterium]|nr:glycosyltransferase family 39 protein [Candidatus Moranbacteria bacterium]